MTDTTQNPNLHSELVKKMHTLVKDDKGFDWVTSDRMQVKVPIKRQHVPKQGPISSEFIKTNRINIFHYDGLTRTREVTGEDGQTKEIKLKPLTPEGNRRVTIAYKYKIDDKDTTLRHVEYGAVVFNPDPKKSHESYDKSGHTRTAIDRLMNSPVTCKLHFHNIVQFKKDLRKFLFTHKTQGQKKVHGSFTVTVDNSKKLSLAPMPLENGTDEIEI